MVLIPLSYNQQLLADTKPLQGQAKIDSLLAELPQEKSDTNETNLLCNLSYEYSSSNPDKGIEYGMKGVALAKKIKWKKGEANCYNSLGINYDNQSDFPKALEYYQKSLKINEKIGNKKGVATNLGNIGTVYQNQSNYLKSLEYHQKALKIFEEIGNKVGIAANLENMGGIYMNQSNFPKALEYYQKALKIYEEIFDRDGIASVFGNIGLIYQAQSNYPKALEYYKKALKINEEIGNKSGFAITLGNIGLIYHTQSNFPKALEYFQKALKINENIGNKSGLANNLINIGELYTGINELDKSLDYLNRGLILNEEIGDNRQVNYTLNMLAGNYNARAKQIDLLQINEEISPVASLFKKEQNYKKALEFGLRAEVLADSIGLGELQHKIYNQVSTAYEGLGQLGKALEYYKKFQMKKDSVFSQENSDKIAALEKTREDDLKLKEIEKQKIRIAEQEKREQLILYFAIAFFVVMTIVMVIIYRLLKRSDKLLYNVLPVSIAKRLKNKEHPISDYFEQASIVFIDIVNFTELSRDADPRRVVEALNKIFTKYDEIANKYGLEKIKTIGDSYMAAAGIPEVQKDNTHRAAQMALEVKAMMRDYHTSDGTKIEVRIGLDCGPVVAGVIGENKFIYDMWSDAVNTASRMESSSIAGHVHVSERFKNAVTEYEEFTYVERGEMEIKGKGKMRTYFIS